MLILENSELEPEKTAHAMDLVEVETVPVDNNPRVSYLRTLRTAIFHLRSGGLSQFRRWATKSKRGIEISRTSEYRAHVMDDRLLQLDFIFESEGRNQQKTPLEIVFF